MTTVEAPAQRRRTVPLTKTQLQTEAGAELLALCERITADGRVTDDEVKELEAWLARHETTDLPAVAFLRTCVSAILEDAIVTPSERRDLSQALERVLPPEQRRKAREARQKSEQEEWAAAVEEEENTYDFMVAGTRHDGRWKVIRERVRPGEQAELVRDYGNKFSANAIGVRVAGGLMVGYVPEFLAAEIAPLLDRSCEYEATFKKVLNARDGAPVPVVIVTVFEAARKENSKQRLVMRSIELLRRTDTSDPEAITTTIERLPHLLKTDLEAINGKNVTFDVVEAFLDACSGVQPALREFFGRCPVPPAAYQPALASLVTMLQDVYRQLRGALAQAKPDDDAGARQIESILERLDAALAAPSPSPTPSPPPVPTVTASPSLSLADEALTKSRSVSPGVLFFVLVCVGVLAGAVYFVLQNR
jgi:hypothetical protein